MNNYIFFYCCYVDDGSGVGSSLVTLYTYAFFPHYTFFFKQGLSCFTIWVFNVAVLVCVFTLVFPEGGRSKVRAEDRPVLKYESVESGKPGDILHSFKCAVFKVVLPLAVIFSTLQVLVWLYIPLFCILNFFFLKTDFFFLFNLLWYCLAALWFFFLDLLIKKKK